ncbi:MAG: hypothetical protein ACUVRG_11910, partial [Ignavibacterium sp.]|uniref:hypothetical protein n=1 Tax=Ignavibacterium sp. TaxID=2651167 RepID=UPI00404B922C
SNGFRVITVTGISEDSVKIILKVSTSIGGDLPTAAITKGGSSEETERSRKNDKQITPEVLVIGGEEIVGYGTVVIKKDEWCDNLIMCNSMQYLPNIILNQVPNGYNGRDICTDEVKPLEGINVYWTDTSYTFELSLCNDDQRQKLWFNINDDHTLKINYSYAICEENLSYSGENCQFIDDWTGISDTLDCDQFEAVLHTTYWYGGHANKPCYFFKNIIYAHEMEHVNDYQMAIESAKGDFFSGLDSINVTCKNFENPDSARNFWQHTLKTKFNQFKKRGILEFIKIQKEGEARSGTYEQDVQNRHSVRAIINSQIDAVNDSYGCTIPYLYK